MSNQEPSPPSVSSTAALPPQAPRRESLTQRFMGVSRDWVKGFYTSFEKDDQQFGHGFNDQADDFVPGVLYNNAEHRRRTSSTGSDGSVDSVENLPRKGSITEKVAELQLNRKPKTQLEGFATTFSTCVDDQ